jgi:peptidoglycan/xylan/chitin deacetylase (PgdA/CDA1 family)
MFLWIPKYVQKYIGRTVFCRFFLAAWCTLCILSGCQTINRTAEQINLPDRTVIFTFDDGPNGDTTARLLDVLRDYDIHGVFALLGENVEHNPALAKRVYDEGHIIINHGYSGKWAVKMGTGEFRAYLVMGEEALIAALGEAPQPRLYRPQGGFYRKQQEKLWQEEGYRIVFGTVRPYDAVLAKKDKGKVIERVTRKIEAEKGGVILLHDGRDSWRKIEARLEHDPDGEFNRSWIPDTVEEIILILREKGYILNGFDIFSVLNASFLTPATGV